MLSRLIAFFSRSIASGLLLVVPPLLAVGILYWLGMTVEGYARPAVLMLLPEAHYWPGLGLLASLLLILLVGMLARNLLLKRVLDGLQRGFEALPVVGPLYRALRDLSRLVADDSSQDGARPVSVRFPELDMTMLGLELPPAVGARLPHFDEEAALVYLPMTYQIGGFLVQVPRARLEPLSMSAMEALQFIIGGGMGTAEAGKGADSDRMQR